MLNWLRRLFRRQPIVVIEVGPSSETETERRLHELAEKAKRKRGDRVTSGRERLTTF
jgi:hypothetical protein